MTFTVSEICEVFFNLEDKYDLNYQEIQGCYPWQLIRMFLYYDIARRLNTFGSPQQKSLSLFDKIKSFTPFLINSILNNPFSGNGKKDILIFDHPRKTIFNNEFMDICSYFLVDLLKGKSFDVMEAPYLNKHYTQKQDYIKYTDRIQLGSYIYKKFNKVNFTKKERELITDVKRELESAFNLNIDFEWILKIHILNFKYDYNAYLKLFQKRNPKIVFVVVAYENQAIVKAAKDLGIEVIELQHGTISNYHLGYSYPLKTQKHGEIAYFPNKILTFGEYWINPKTCPISHDDIIPIGFPYFETQSKDFKEIKSKPKQILFISQGVIGKYLSKIAVELAGELTDYEIIYKLHPGEYETWSENYPDLVCDLDNFKVIDNSKTPLYQLFAESSIQIGAFSTAIYEGLMFDCKTFVFNLPGVEYLDDLVDNGYVCKVNDLDELLSNLNSFHPKKYDGNFFFKDYDEELIKKVILNE